MHAPFVYEELNIESLQAHIRYLAENLENNSRIELLIEDINVEIPIIKNTFKVKPTTVSLLVRSSSVGRESLEELYNWLKYEEYSLKVRKSTKKKLVSQIKVVWSTNDNLYPLHVIAGLKGICTKIGCKWPPKLSIGYYACDVNYNLPGKLKSGSLSYKAGKLIGYAVGKIASKL